MTQSMTAFARTQKQEGSVQLSWEIRSVNHRYLDVSFRLPDIFRFIEPHLRAALRDKVHRGKLECQLKYQDTSSDKQAMIINKGMINALVELSHDVASTFQLDNDLSVGKVLQWPGVVLQSQLDIEEFGQQAIQLFNDAVLQLIQARFSRRSGLENTCYRQIAKFK